MITKNNQQHSTRPVKVAIACPGVGLVQRGFERMASDLFKLLREDLDVTLFKGGGQNEANEQRLIFITRHGRFQKWFPIHRLVGRTSMHAECFTFAISLLIAIRGKNFDIIHCTDPPLARILYKLRRIFRLNFRLLYTEACAMPPGDYPPADHMHQISPVTCEEAASQGIPGKYMTVIPLGIFPETFRPPAARNELRAKFGIDDETFVVLSLAAVNRYHKRIDYLIEEFRGVRGQCLLWIDGSLQHGDSDLVDIARDTLGARCRITHFPSSRVSELFAVADLMVHTALYEAFGLALVEGASTGLPVLTHDTAHFRWLMGNEPATIDMSIEGALASSINSLAEDHRQLGLLENSRQILKRYSWNELKSSYLQLYSHVASLPGSEIGVAHRYGLG